MPERGTRRLPPTTGWAPRSSSIPVKAFHQAKRRLGSALADPDRVRLVRAMATHVVSACAPLPVAVVCDDEEVAQWASDLGAAVMWEPGQGLNGAVRAGVDRLARAGTVWVTVAHGDLPRARGLGALPRVRRGHPRSRPPRRRHQRAAAPRRERLPLRVRSRVLPGPPGRSDAPRPRLCACCVTRTSPTTSTGRPTWTSSASAPDRSPDAEPGARRPPVSRVPNGTRRLAPLCRLAGGAPTRGLLGRRALLDGLASRSPLGCAFLAGAASWWPCEPEPA